MEVEEFESINDFKRGFLALAEACSKKFKGKIKWINIYPDSGQVEIVFT